MTNNLITNVLMTNKLMTNLQNYEIMKTLYLFFSILFTFQLSAQITIVQDGKKEALPNMILQVKQLDEFINRFNYKQDFYGNKIIPQFKQQFPRDKYISLLFNNQDIRILQKQEGYFKNIEYFINDVTSGNGQYIAKHSTQIYAVAICNLIYKGKNVKAKLVLNREVNNNYAKWVIRKADANFLALPPKTKSISSLPPNSNETDFISLKKILDKKDNYSSLVKSQFEYNQLSTFLHLISTGELKFKYVEKIKYLILDIKDWAIAVQEFNRDSENSGWLISNISKQDNKLLEYLGIEH